MNRIFKKKRDMDFFSFITKYKPQTHSELLYYHKEYKKLQRTINKKKFILLLSSDVSGSGKNLMIELILKENTNTEFIYIEDDIEEIKEQCSKKQLITSYLNTDTTSQSKYVLIIEEEYLDKHTFITSLLKLYKEIPSVSLLFLYTSRKPFYNKNVLKIQKRKHIHIHLRQLSINCLYKFYHSILLKEHKNVSVRGIQMIIRISGFNLRLGLKFIYQILQSSYIIINIPLLRHILSLCYNDYLKNHTMEVFHLSFIDDEHKERLCSQNVLGISTLIYENSYKIDQYPDIIESFSLCNTFNHYNEYLQYLIIIPYIDRFENVQYNKKISKTVLYNSLKP